MSVIMNRTRHYLYRYSCRMHTSFLHRHSYYNRHSVTKTLVSKSILPRFPPSSVRFFAAPVQFLKKEETKKVTGVRLNEQIKADFIRLVSDEGHSVISRHEALHQAKSLKLDLVEVDRHSEPPVCKIMDYNKERYQQQVRDKERAKKKAEGTLKKGDCKEVRFSAKTETKDLKMKADTAKRLMERGYRVKCMAMGNEDQDLGGLITQLSSMIEDVAFIEYGPRIEKKQAYIIVRHVKFGPSKKGGKKGSNVDSTSSSETRNVAGACNDNRAGQSDEEEEASSSAEEYASDNGDVGPQYREQTVHQNRSIGTTEKQMRFDTKAGYSAGPGSSPPRMPNFADQNARSSSQQPEPANRYAGNVPKNVSAAKFDTRMPNFVDQNVRLPSQPPQPENRYARNVPNTRFPNSGSHPHNRGGGFAQGGVPRQDRDRGEVPVPHQVGPTGPHTHPRGGFVQGGGRGDVSPPRQVGPTGPHIQPRGGFVQGGGRGDVSIPHQAGPAEQRSGAGNLRPPSSGFGVFSAKDVNQSPTPSNTTARNSNPDTLKGSKPSGDERRGNSDGGKYGVFSR